VAIALHNIAEGLAVSAPLLYATGNRPASFAWGVVSGITEPVGAIVGWALLRSVLTPAVFAAIFGLVGGMMVWIVVKELLPGAHRHDPADAVSTYAFVGGAFVMGLSLVLFEY
jgi:zinc transporter, ZIP family